MVRRAGTNHGEECHGNHGKDHGGLVINITINIIVRALSYVLSRWTSPVTWKVWKIDTETSNHGGVVWRLLCFQFSMVSIPPRTSKPDPKLSPFSKSMHLMGTHRAALSLITNPVDLPQWNCCQFRVGWIHFTYRAPKGCGLVLGSWFYSFVFTSHRGPGLQTKCYPLLLLCLTRHRCVRIVFSLKQTAVHRVGHSA